MKDFTIAVTASAALIGAWFVSLCAWITAIVTTVQTSNIAMLIVDLLIPPVGVIHGLMIWFGAA